MDPSGKRWCYSTLNNVVIDYDSIKLHTEASREMLAYVRSQDPNRG